jgi:hypothetical protein
MQSRPIQFMVLFLLRHGHQARIVTNETMARKIVADWLKNGFGKDKISNLDYPPGDQPWAVDTKEILCVQTMMIDPRQGAQQQIPAYQSPFGIPQSGM